jgi:hypothetical protein
MTVIELPDEQAAALKAFFISRDDLIAAKLAAGRPQDLADVDAIRKAAESQCPQPAKKSPRRHGAALASSTHPGPCYAPAVFPAEQPLEFFAVFFAVAQEPVFPYSESHGSTPHPRSKGFRPPRD